MPQAARIGDVDSDGDVIISGSSTVFIGDQSFSTSAIAARKAELVAAEAAHNADELDDGTPEGAAALSDHNQAQVAAGVYKQSDLSKPVAAPANADTTPPTTQSAVPMNCSAFTPTTVYAASLPLTSKTTLGDMTINVVFPHPIQPNKGLSLPNIACNLKNLAENCWEPIKAQYPGAFLTCSFRPGNSEKQHGDGCAMDMQFKGSQKADYFSIAQWIKNNVAFDQLLLEYKTTGTGNPWKRWSSTCSRKK